MSVGCLVSADTSSGWTETDLDYIHSTILDNHPGVYNESDPGFCTHLERHYQQAKHQLSLAAHDADRIVIIKEFVASFHDTHLYIRYMESHENKAVRTPKYFSIESVDTGVHWVRLPTFAPNDTEKQSLSRIIDELPAMRCDKLIIFDIRGNGGGNSDWGQKIVAALFGQEYTVHHIAKANAHVYVDWRASYGNILHMQKLKQQNQHTFSPESDFMKWIDSTLEGMQSAYASGLHYYTAKNQPLSSHEQNPKVFKNPVHATIVVLMDHGCVSAALDFIDYIKAMNHPVVLVGQTTRADSLYMECRTIDLPSKKGTFCFPIKVYRNRVRKHNEPYVPDIVWDNAGKDLKDIQQLVADKKDALFHA